MYKNVEHGTNLVRLVFNFLRNYIPDKFYDIKNLLFLNFICYAWLYTYTGIKLGYLILQSFKNYYDIWSFILLIFYLFCWFVTY